MFPVTVSVQMDSIQIHTSTSRQAVISIAPLTQQNLDDIFMKHIKKIKKKSTTLEDTPRVHVPQHRLSAIVLSN